MRAKLNTTWSAHAAAFAVLAAAAIISCDGASTEEEGASDWQATSAAPFGSTTVLDELPRVNLDVADVSDKSRRTNPIDYDELAGNGVVLVENTRAICSAQVINSTALLTAGHCIDDLGLSSLQTLDVSFTKRDRTLSLAYRGLAVGVKQPNWGAFSRDTGVIILNGMNTCQRSLSDCNASQPDIPVNTAFQFFIPNQTNFTATSYVIVGYGATNNLDQNARVLRAGVMNLESTAFTSDNAGFETRVNWTQDSQSRPCRGDSGSPLVTGITVLGRAMHTGVASANPGTGGCDATIGLYVYSGLSATQASWVLSVLAANRTAARPFDCAAGSQSGVHVFLCDNDGTVF